MEFNFGQRLVPRDACQRFDRSPEHSQNHCAGGDANSHVILDHKPAAPMANRCDLDRPVKIRFPKPWQQRPQHRSRQPILVRGILFYQAAANYTKPEVKGLTTMANSIYNQSRFEDLWLQQGIGSSAGPAARR